MVLAVLEGVTDGVPDFVGVLDGDRVGVCDLDPVIVVVPERVAVPDGVIDGVPDLEGVPEDVPVTERDADTVGDGVCETEAP